MIGLLALATTTFQTGNDLYVACAQADKTWCYAYLAGLADGFAFEENATPLICIPPHADTRQLADIVVEFLRTHPERRHYQAGSLVWGALFDAFRCPNVPKPK